jgi:hypothetical protein
MFSIYIQRIMLHAVIVKSDNCEHLKTFWILCKMNNLTEYKSIV